MDDLVSITAVTDPMAAVGEAELRRIFPDLVRRYKENFIIDLRHPSPSRNNRRRATKALSRVTVTFDAEPRQHLDEWVALFDVLRERHGFSGLASFSRHAFAEQLATPGCVTARASVDGTTVSMVVSYVMDDLAYAHLAASSEQGYRIAASFAVHQAMIDEFMGRGLRWLVLGATSGADADTGDGLTVFKRGWTRLTRPSYLCGRIGDRHAYERIAHLRPGPVPGWFPAYRGP
jgi:hypothetical protein